MINILSITITYLSIFASSYLNHHLLWSSPVTISTLGLLGTFYSHQGKIEKGDVHALILMGAFAGTTAEPHFQHHLAFISNAAVIYFIFKYTKHKFVGLGGKLGFISFSSCLCFYGASLIVHRILP